MNKFLLSFMATSLLVSGVAFAQTSTDVQSQIKAVQDSRQSSIDDLITSVKIGANGDAVKKLQQILSVDSSVYPEGIVNGHFGPKTAQAVKRFQKKHGLRQLGSVGPQTVDKLKAFIKDNAITVDGEKNDSNGEDKKLCTILPPGSSQNPMWMKMPPEKLPLPVCQNLPTDLANAVGVIHWSNSGSTDDVTKVQIKGVYVSDVTSSSARISWMTNVASKGKIWDSTTNPVSTSGNANLEEPEYTTSHSVVISGLSPMTHYYFVVGSSDANGNTAYASQSDFTTTMINQIPVGTSKVDGTR